ncbi:DUF418 domain-containing protein [Asanoa siamensis]|uniref:DUF418 domain-containing protein n=1 Tax=Asanoa siamensis TaxID=926357 RepID=UPI001EF2776B|nr:DUF418 domain-containing protein [Asanoa siamensis]
MPNFPQRAQQNVRVASASPADNRIAGVDALRGLALLGIFVVNIAYFASGYPFHLVPDPQYASGLEMLLPRLVDVLVTMKAYLVFSFLFGYSFTLQMDSAARRGVEFTPRFLRRLAGLFAIGLVHAVLLFQGDILTTYALLGLVLLGMRRTRERTALVTGAVITGVVAFAIALTAVGGVDLVPDPAAAQAAGAASTEALRGGLGSLVGEHLRSMPAMLSALAVQGPLALFAFLVGLAAGRRRALADTTAYQRQLRLIQRVGYPIGIAGGIVFAAGGGTHNVTGLLISILTAPLLAAAYVATALRFFHGPRGARIVAALAPAGRMALSNYLGQSMVAVLIFSGVGLGLAGTVSPTAAIGIAIVVYCGQLVVSRAWMARFRYGPVEWLLRAWTEWRRPPFVA